MREYNSRHGKREAPGRENPLAGAWNRYRYWVDGLSRGELIRYRVCLVLAVIAVLALIVTLWLRTWIKLPDVPDPFGPSGGLTVPGGSQELPDVSYSDADLPDVVLSGRKEGCYTFLLCGQDVVSGATDTMILLNYDTKGQKVNAISLLRDTMINTSASSKRLNTVYARNRGDRKLPDKERVENGMTALKQEVRKLTGIQPDFYVLVEWEAIGNLVDAVGGVEFQVPFDMDYDDPYQDLHIHQKKGLRLLDGRDAMEVIRFRKNNNGTHQLGDSGRTQIQRDFLTATIKKCLTPEIVLKLPALVDIFVENVDTDLSVGNILAFAQLAVGMDVENSVKFVSMPYTGTSYGGASMVLPKQDELLEILNDGIDPYQDEIGADDLQLMYRKSGGGYGVTNATLADPALSRGAAPAQPAPDKPKDGGSTGSKPPKQNGQDDPAEEPGESGENGGSGENSEPGEPGENGEPPVDDPRGENGLPRLDGPSGEGGQTADPEPSGPSGLPAEPGGIPSGPSDLPGQPGGLPGGGEDIPAMDPSLSRPVTAPGGENGGPGL